MLYTCKAETYAMFADVKAMIDTANALFDLDLHPGKEAYHVISAGARKWGYNANFEIEMTPLIETEAQDVLATMPDLPELMTVSGDDVFDDLFEIPEVHIDIMGGSGETRSKFDTQVEDPTTGGFTDVTLDIFSEVYFGYRIAADEDEPTYFGIMFETTLPYNDYGGKNNSVINWAKYERFSNGELVDSAAAVCIVKQEVDAVTFEPVFSYETRTYEFGASDIGDIDNPDLESYRLSSSDEIWSILETDDFEMNYGMDFHDYEGTVTTRCLATVEWEEDEHSDDYAIYQVESGVRWADDDDTTMFYDFQNAIWDTEFREPNEFVAPTLQSVFTVVAEETNDYNEVTSRQEVIVGYEITNDIQSDNMMGFIFELNLPATEAVTDAVIYQTVQYRKKFDYASDWVGIACVTKVGGGADEAEVKNFRSTGDLTGLDAGSEVDYSYADSESEIYEGTDEQPELYEARYGDDGAYELEENSDISGNKLQRCVA